MAAEKKQILTVKNIRNVNMENILSASPRSFRMKNGEAFPITRKYAAAKDIFLKYKFKEGD